MSKYEPLWKYVQAQNVPALSLTFAQIESILGFAIDHSFLNYKKELVAYGYTVGKISLKKQTVLFNRVDA